MKKVLFIIIAIFIIGCSNKKEYNDKLKKTTEVMAELTYFSGHIADDYTEVWRTAIYDNRYQGNYCSDFNEALSKHMEFVKGTSLYQTIHLKKDTLDMLIRELKEYPSEYEKAYNEAVSLYTDVDQLTGYADSPSGSLSSYSALTSDLVISITKKIKEFRLKHVE
ncbi:hypothetical protein [Bacteroides sp.]|uniref:hypothetical protein n=1 Tax=Bacteroides sp. TaxID=29523 RepID=UPI0025C5C095|nr:hypothetical protein [Bacteroides sp.]